MLNSFEKSAVFEDLPLSEEETESCSETNTMILSTLNDSEILKLAEPKRVIFNGVSFFISAIVPEKHSDDPVLPHTDDEISQKADLPVTAKTKLPDKESDFVVYYLYNGGDYSPEELNEGLLGVQNREVNLIFSGKYKVGETAKVRPQLYFFSSSDKPEIGVMVFSLIKTDEDEKKVFVRSFNRRFI